MTECIENTVSIADHALKAIKEPGVGVTKKVTRSNVKKAVRWVMEDNLLLIKGWIDDGWPTSMIVAKLEASSTSFWQHINELVSEEYILTLRENGKKANRITNYTLNLGKEDDGTDTSTNPCSKD